MICTAFGFLVLSLLANLTKGATVAPGQAIDCTFGASLQTSQNNSINLENVVLDNRLNGLNTVLNQCWMKLDDSWNLVEICASVGPSNTIQLQSLGGYPTPIGFDWMATSQDGLETGCRSGALRLTIGTSFKLFTAAGVLLSPERQAGWSSFSISNSMKYFSDFFSGYSHETLNGYSIIPFTDIHANPSNENFNSADHQYSCKNGEYYFFSFSAGVLINNETVVALEVLDKIYMAQRKSSKVNGLTTISRSILIPCQTTVKIVVYSGTIVPRYNNNTNLIHFMAFPYEKKTGISASWAAYKKNNSVNEQFLSFDNWEITQNITRSDNNKITVTVAGHYYVYVSIGTSPNQISSVSFRKNNTVMFRLERLSRNFDGVDTIGHGTMIYLEKNDMLQVAVERNSIISSDEYGYHTSFLGMLISE